MLKIIIIYSVVSNLQEGLQWAPHTEINIQFSPQQMVTSFCLMSLSSWAENHPAQVRWRCSDVDTCMDDDKLNKILPLRNPWLLPVTPTHCQSVPFFWPLKKVDLLSEECKSICTWIQKLFWEVIQKEFLAKKTVSTQPHSINNDGGTKTMDLDFSKTKFKS